MAEAKVLTDQQLKLVAEFYEAPLFRLVALHRNLEIVMDALRAQVTNRIEAARRQSLDRDGSADNTTDAKTADDAPVRRAWKPKLHRATADGRHTRKIVLDALLDANTEAQEVWRSDHLTIDQFCETYGDRETVAEAAETLSQLFYELHTVQVSKPENCDVVSSNKFAPLPFGWAPDVGMTTLLRAIDVSTDTWVSPAKTDWFAASTVYNALAKTIRVRADPDVREDSVDPTPFARIKDVTGLCSAILRPERDRFEELISLVNSDLTDWKPLHHFLQREKLANRILPAILSAAETSATELGTVWQAITDQDQIDLVGFAHNAYSDAWRLTDPSFYYSCRRLLTDRRYANNFEAAAAGNPSLRRFGQAIVTEFNLDGPGETSIGLSLP